MTHSTRARNSNLIVELTYPNGVLPTAEEKTSLSGQGILQRDDGHFIVAGQKEAKNRLEHWLRKMKYC